MGGASYNQLAFEFMITPSAVRDVVRSLKLPFRSRTKCRDIPPDLRDIVMDVGIEGARAHYKTGWATIKRWIEDAGIDVTQRKRRIQSIENPVEVPTSWDKIAPTLYKYQVAEYYGISVNRVNRLIAITGIRTRPTLHELARTRPPAPPKQKKPRPKGRPFRTLLTQAMPLANITNAQQAAQHLRRYLPNVHRCDILMREFDSTTWGQHYGVPNKGIGYYFVCGHGVLSNEKMIELAKGYGFCPSSL